MLIHNMVKVISAIGVNGEYAYKGKLPWSKEYGKLDMQFFREYTKNATIIMGYNTWMSVGKLPNRLNIVISRAHHRDSHLDDNLNDILTFTNLKSAIDQYPNAIVIGGASLIHELCVKYAHQVDEIVINQFPDKFDADVYLDLHKIPMIKKTIYGTEFNQLIYTWKLEHL